MGFCNNCEDVFHNMAGKDFEKYNHINDYLLYANLLLVASQYKHLDVKLFRKLLPILVALFIFRHFLAMITNCEAPVRRDSRPTLSLDKKWYVISGHLSVNMFTTYLILNSSAPQYLQCLSMALTILVFCFGIVSREHYSKDMFLTFVFVSLILKNYG